MAVRLAYAGLMGLLFMAAGCGLKHPRLPADKAALVGMAEDREAREQDSSVEGRILRLDGHAVKFAREKHIDPGCHLVEVEVKYIVIRLKTEDPCPALEVFGACKSNLEVRVGAPPLRDPHAAGEAL